MTLEEKLKRADEMDARMRVKPTGVSPHPPEKPWLKEVQKRNPYYQEIFNERKVPEELGVPA